MLLNLPLYANNIDGTNCAQCAALSILKHYFPDRDYSIEELAQKMKKKKGLYTYTHQITTLLWDEGLDVKQYGNYELKEWLRGEDFLRETYSPEDAEEILKHSDMKNVVETLKEALKYDLFEKKDVSSNDLEEWLKQDYPIIPNVDWSVLYEVDAPFDGHYVTLTGFDTDCFYYLENGSKKAHAIVNQKVNKKRFMKALSKEKELIVCFGIRNQ